MSLTKESKYLILEIGQKHIMYHMYYIRCETLLIEHTFFFIQSMSVTHYTSVL